MPDFPPNTIAVFDLDGTLTRRDTFLGIVLHSLRLYPGNIPSTLRLVGPVLGFGLGRVDNTALKTAFLKALLAGLPAARLGRLVESFLDELFTAGFRKEGLAVLERHRAAGHGTVLLSAAPDFYVEEIARRLRFDHCLCTGTARREDDTLTGELSTANCRGEEKVRRLHGHFGASVDRYYFVGYGDRESDLPLLVAVDHGIIVNPKPVTKARAERAGLRIARWK